jgi:hypothetical protein
MIRKTRALPAQKNRARAILGFAAPAHNADHAALNKEFPRLKKENRITRARGDSNTRPTD